MKKTFYLALVIILSFTLNYCIDKNEPEKVNQYLPKNNILTENEKSNGWILLFDGKTTNGWHEFGKEKVETGWVVKNGELLAFSDENSKSSDIITDDKFFDFDFICEWKISNGGNSGIFYHIQEGENFRSPIDSAPEYQLIDDIGFPGKLEEWQKTGANYAMHNPSQNKKLKNVDEWNMSRIIVKDSLVQHFINGEKIVEFKRWTNDWKMRVQNSKWKEHPNYGLYKEGSIGLQSHGNSIWFRNIKIRQL